jgi:hypothetical protein
VTPWLSAPLLEAYVAAFGVVSALWIVGGAVRDWRRRCHLSPLRRGLAELAKTNGRGR